MRKREVIQALKDAGLDREAQMLERYSSDENTLQFLMARATKLLDEKRAEAERVAKEHGYGL